MLFRRQTVTTRTRIVGALGAVALAISAVGVTTPAQAASGTLTYTCTIQGQAKQVIVVADTDAPARIAFGETIAPSATGTLTIPEDVATQARTAGAKKADGKADVTATVDGVARQLALTVPQTNVPPNGPLVLEATGPAGSFAGTAVGTVYDVAVGNFTTVVNLYEANGTPIVSSPLTIPCVQNPGQAAAVDTIKVVKDTTTTTVQARDVKKGAKAKAKVRVVADHGTTAKGKVKAKLVRNGKLLETKMLALRDGVRKVVFQRLHQTGTFAIKAKYVGRESWKASRGADPFSVG